MSRPMTAKDKSSLRFDDEAGNRFLRLLNSLKVRMLSIVMGSIGRNKAKEQMVTYDNKKLGFSPMSVNCTLQVPLDTFG